MFLDANVFVEAGDADSQAFMVTLEMARAGKAHVSLAVTAVAPFYPYEVDGAVAMAGYGEQLAELRGVANATRDRLAALADRAGVPCVAHLLVADVETLAVQAAMLGRHADLNILGARGESADRWVWERIAESLLFDSGRALLTLPRQAEPLRANRPVAVAWNASVQAARALGEARPWLNSASEVVLLLVDPRPGETGHGEEAGADIAAHLARCGFKARVERIASAGRPAGMALQAAALDMGASLLVMGGYGHSRLREMLLGGVTRDVFAQQRLPILMAH